MAAPLELRYVLPPARAWTSRPTQTDLAVSNPFIQFKTDHVHGVFQMSLTDRLLTVALFGAEWVLWLLIALSVVSVAIMIERLIYFRSNAVDFEGLRAELKDLLGQRNLEKARQRVAERPGAIESEVVMAGLAKFNQGPMAVGEAMTGAKARAKLRLQRNLAFLGTLGNNAPFVGLFGTVIGVIKAFHDLAARRGQGPEAVMGSLSEALIATAVGLIVAIPAVIAFNYFNGQVRERVAHADTLAHEVLAEMGRGETSKAAEAK
jgi:biopolymer transport protein ExbB